MEHQFRRGINRPNAQRLSISLAPLVAQRSLLFRVKADLAGMQTNYGELTPTEDSPGLFALSSTASARIISAALSAMSTASVWSQDSWKGESSPSPFAPILVHVPVPLRHTDTRRHAIAFSPSVQWEALAEEGQVSEDSDRDSELALKTPLQSASSAGASIVLPNEDPRNSTEITSIPIPSVEDANENLNAAPEPKAALESQFPMKLQDLEGGPASGKLRKKQKGVGAGDKDRDNNNPNKRLSRPAKAFGKVMSHLSLQPSSSKKESREAAAAARRQTAFTVTEYKLPDLEFKAGLSPMRMSFVAGRNGNAPPVLLAQPAPLQAPPRPQQPQQRWTIPPPPPPPPPPAVTPAPMSIPARKVHRRYNSSPAVPQFALNLNFKGWETEKMPPVPQLPIPTILATSSLPVQRQTPVRVRARSRSTDWDAEKMLMPPLHIPVPRLPTIPATPAALTPSDFARRARSRSVSASGPIRAVSPPFPVRQPGRP